MIEKLLANFRLCKCNALNFLTFFFLCGYLGHPEAKMLWAYYCSVKRAYHPCKVTDKLPIAAVSCN